MRRLSWKFSTAIWTGMATVAVAIAIGLWAAKFLDVLSISRAESARLRIHLDTTRTLLEAGDVLALRHIEMAAKRGTYNPTYLLDPQGRDLLGRPLDAATWAQVRATADQLDFTQARKGSGMVQRVSMPDGTVAIVFVPAAVLRMAHSQAISESPAPLWILVLAAMLVSTSFGGMMALYVSRPIRSLNWALQRMAAGEFDTWVLPLMDRRKDELADLGATFDHIAHRIQLLMSKQQRLMHDIAHELRSPLARMHAALGLARQQPERAVAMNARVERESIRLNALVSELLVLARVDAGEHGGARAFTDVMTLVRTVCEDAQFEACATNRNLVLMSKGECSIEAHGEFLHRAFENVVRNAVKFTREGTTVIVNAEANETGVVVSVIDQGPGVPEDARNKMFEPFQRIGHAGVEGFGLGLSIAKRAIESHGGCIEVHTAPGTEAGLCVQITLSS